MITKDRHAVPEKLKFQFNAPAGLERHGVSAIRYLSESNNMDRCLVSGSRVFALAQLIKLKG